MYTIPGKSDSAVSTHASVRRRRGAGVPWLRGCGFNSRLREEATHDGGGIRRTDGVSTHASVRRRPLGVEPVSRSGSFNSRLREEATPDA